MATQDDNMTVAAAIRILAAKYNIKLGSYGLRTHIKGGSPKLVQPELKATFERNPAVPKGYYLIALVDLEWFAAAYIYRKRFNSKLGMHNRTKGN